MLLSQPRVSLPRPGIGRSRLRHRCVIGGSRLVGGVVVERLLRRLCGVSRCTWLLNRLAGLPGLTCFISMVRGLLLIDCKVVSCVMLGAASLGFSRIQIAQINTLMSTTTNRICTKGKPRRENRFSSPIDKAHASRARVSATRATLGFLTKYRAVHPPTGGAPILRYLNPDIHRLTTR